MKISILTLFPEMFQGPFDYSILKRVKEKGIVDIKLINIRDFGIGVHKLVDDTPYGGGVGMVMRVDVLHRAIEHAKGIYPDLKSYVVLMSASGKTFNQKVARVYSELDHLILICGHYEGVDDRIKNFINEEVSIGDYVLTGGEIPAMAITDSITRLLAGAITDGAVDDESFSPQDKTTLLEYPHFTKPREYQGFEVPEILLQGNHAKIKEWKTKEAIAKTKRVRPDLLK